jgi:hypothetical protein
MRKTLVPFMAVLLAVALTLPAFAQQQQQPGQRPGAGKEARESQASASVTGTITKVDAAAGTVSVQTSDGQNAVLTVDSSTKITVAGKKGSIADLKDGQTVKLKAKGSKAVSIEG